MKQKRTPVKISRQKTSLPHVGLMGNPRRATRANRSLSRTLGPDEPPADRGAAEKETKVQGSE